MIDHSNKEHQAKKVDAIDRAEMYLFSMRLAEAIDAFRDAEAVGVDPDRCAAGCWQCYMLAGDFESAWNESDSISRRGGFDPHRFWNGEPLDGKHILIRCLHGLGDTLQFVRYCPQIRTRAERLVIEAQPKLKGLLECSGLADEVITWGDPEPYWNQQLEINELPRIFRTTLPTIPKNIPYLKPPSASTAAGYHRGRKLRAGLVWTAGAFDPSRTILLRLWASLLALPGIEFFDLQGGSGEDRVPDLGGRLLHLEEGSRGLLATADHVASMDLIITVDTMMAHLAGALGRPVWTLIPFRCDWRWMTGRTDSPWYPTMRLFRQSKPGEWAPVMECVRDELAAVLARGELNCFATL